MKAVKGNKAYTTNEQEQKSYTSSGLDILDDNGNTVAYGSGKTVSYDEYAKVKAELDSLKAAESEKPPKSPKKEDK